MEKVIYKNTEGKSIVLADTAPYLLSDKEGFDSVDNTINSSKGYNQDGESYVSQSLGVRNLRLSGTVVGKNKVAYLKLRKNMISIFNPKIAGTIEYENDIGIYEIDVIPEFLPRIDSKSFNGIDRMKSYDVLLKALDPYWTDKSLVDGAVPLSIVIPEWSFPLEVTDTFEFATIDSGSIINVENNGDIPVGATFHIRFGADVVNPRVYNVLTQDFFGMSGTYSSGSEVRISTMRGKKKVEQNDGAGWYNAMTKRLNGSTFLQLDKGINSLQMQADSGVENTVATVDYEPKIVGV